jgi:DNA-binding Lrp family transcriptional regulator
MPTAFDRTDRRLLLALQQDARLTTAQLAERVALSPSPCWRRIKALESGGAIRGYHARLDAPRLGWGVTAFIHIMLENHRRDLGERFEQAVLGIEQVIACHNVSGEYDYLLQVVARDLQDFGEFARDVLRALPGVKEINSSLSLREVKSGFDLPVPDR